MVADSADFPIDKACGEGLMPDAQDAFDKLGMELRESDGFPFRGVRFLDGEVSVDASFPHGRGIGMRRIVLHRRMVEHAAKLGVILLPRTRVSEIEPEGVRIGGSLLRSRWIVGADGGASRVRAWAGLDGYSHVDARFGFRRHYRVTPWTHCMEIYWGNGGQIYVTPIGPREVCVALISRDKRLRLDEALTEFPAVLERLRGAEAMTAERGAVTFTRRLKSVYKGRVALAGDASGSVDAITGEGLCLAFRQALALADGIVNNDLRSYQTEHERILRLPGFMARTMLLMESRARLRHRALSAMSSSPKIFAGMLAMHVGAASPLAFAARGIQLGVRMLAA
jgi:flavin-dependent dehydrogenase